MAECKCNCESAGNVNVPITGITVPFCGFGVNIDPTGLGGLSREEIQAMIDDAMGTMEEKIVANRYNLCEFYFFRHPDLRPGFRLAHGGLLEGAAELHPEAWAYLQTEEGQKLCVTEADWQGMSAASFATLSDGTEIGWEGVGGVPFYALDLETGALRLPDLRGMYAEASGFDSLEVGGVHGDQGRKLAFEASQIHAVWSPYTGMESGPLKVTRTYYYNNINTANGSGMANGNYDLSFDNERVTPVGNKNAPRAFGALPCVYLGVPK